MTYALKFSLSSHLHKEASFHDYSSPNYKNMGDNARCGLLELCIICARRLGLGSGPLPLAPCPCPLPLPALSPALPCPALPCPCLARLLLWTNLSEEANHGMSLELNPKNRFGRFGRLRWRGVGRLKRALHVRAPVANRQTTIHSKLHCRWILLLMRHCTANPKP